MIIKSDSITEVSKALVKAQQEMGKALKDSTNPAFKSKYADLTSCLDAVMPALHNNGLALTQLPSGDIENVSLTTLITHTSGEYVGSTDSIPRSANSRNAAHEHGSALTYLRRYGLAAVCGLGQEDDDGNSISKSAKKVDTSATEITLTQAAQGGIAALQSAWESAPNDAKKAIADNRAEWWDKLKSIAADIDAAKAA